MGCSVRSTNAERSSPSRCFQPLHSIMIRGSYPRSSEYGTYKTVQTRIRPWLPGKNPQNLPRCSILARNRSARVKMQPSGPCALMPIFQTFVGVSRHDKSGGVCVRVCGPWWRASKVMFVRSTRLDRWQRSAVEHTRNILNI